MRSIVCLRTTIGTDQHGELAVRNFMADCDHFDHAVSGESLHFARHIDGQARFRLLLLLLTVCKHR